MLCSAVVRVPCIGKSAEREGKNRTRTAASLSRSQTEKSPKKPHSSRESERDILKERERESNGLSTSVTVCR